MASETKTLLDFVMGTRYQDLPDAVVHESKRLLLDSIGVAIAGLKSEKGRLGVELAKRLGGPSESRIIGTAEKVSCSSAAFANGELINALDFDALLFPTHSPPAVIPAVLALGEIVGASGKAVLLSIALASEIAFRFGKAIRGQKKIFQTEEGSEAGKIVGTRYSISPVGAVVIGGALGAGKIVDLDYQKMTHCLGLAAHFTPIPQSRWKIAERMPMSKYICCGWASQAEVTAVLLAQMGYTSDMATLDGDLGLWRFFGSDRWDREIFLEGLGTEWKMLKVAEYKPYPCCRELHVVLDCVMRIIEAHDVKAQEIKNVRVLTQSSLTGPLMKTREIEDHMVAQFSLPYVVSAALNRINLDEWQDRKTMRDQRVLEFMDKVSQEPHPDFFKVERQEPGANMTAVEILTGRGTFREEGKHPRGLPRPGLAMGDEDLVKKFRSSARALPSTNVSNVISTIWGLEKVDNICDLIDQVTF